MSTAFRGLIVSIGLVLSLSSDVWALGEERALAEPSFAGQWTATALSEVWKFGAWPGACGPKPSSEASPGGLSLVNEESGELSFAGLGRAFRTNQCWEQYPGLRRVAHSRSAQAWSSTCKSADSDPRQANVHTQVTAFGDTLLKFRESGTYEFHIGNAKCSAQVTRTRTFSRGSHEVNAAATAVAVPSVPEVPAGIAGAIAPGQKGDATQPAAAGASGVAGAHDTSTATHGVERTVRSDCEASAEDLEIRIPRPVNWLQPGASYRLTPAVVDATGCVAAKGPFTYTVEPATDAVRVGLKSGLVQVAANAPEGKYTVIIRSGQLREVIEVPVITREGLSAFLQAPTEPPLGSDNAEPAVREILGTSPAAAADSATPRKWWFTGLAGLVIFGLGMLGLRLLRAGSRPTMPPPAPRGAASSSGVVAGVATSTVAPPQAAVASGQLALTMVPPPVDQSPATQNSSGQASPVQRRSNPPPKPRAGNVEPTGVEGRACPQCGTQYTDGSVFCGVDGAKLPVPAERLLEKRS